MHARSGLFHEKPTKASAIQTLSNRFAVALREAGQIAMSGQIVEASLILAPRQPSARAEKEDIGAGRMPEARKRKPAKLGHEDRAAGRTTKFTEAEPRKDGTVPAADLAVPAFGDQDHIAIDRGFGIVRRWPNMDAAAHEGRRLREVCSTRRAPPASYEPTRPDARRRIENMTRNGFVSQVHRKKPQG